MGKKKRDTGISLDSFLDILTCLQGVLMLIIITTGIDAAQTKIIMATPIELTGGERPIFIEARNNMLFRVPVEDARRAVLERQAELLEKRRSNISMATMLEEVGKSDIDVGAYRIDFTRFLAGQIAMMPKEDAIGHTFEVKDQDSEENWFAGVMRDMDRSNERIHFWVRDDSFDVFKRARFVAWTKDIKVSYSLISLSEPLIANRDS